MNTKAISCLKRFDGYFPGTLVPPIMITCRLNIRWNILKRTNKPKYAHLPPIVLKSLSLLLFGQKYRHTDAKTDTHITFIQLASFVHVVFWLDIIIPHVGYGKCCLTHRSRCAFYSIAYFTFLKNFCSPQYLHFENIAVILNFNCWKRYENKESQINNIPRNNENPGKSISLFIKWNLFQNYGLINHTIDFLYSPSR